MVSLWLQLSLPSFLGLPVDCFAVLRMLPGNYRVLTHGLRPCVTICVS